MRYPFAGIASCDRDGGKSRQDKCAHDPLPLANNENDRSDGSDHIRTNAQARLRYCATCGTLLRERLTMFIVRELVRTAKTKP
jgi:hypothetical protein